MNVHKKLLNYLKERFNEGLLFFLFFFIILLLVNLFHFFLSPKPSLSNALFFLMAHFGQSLATVCFLALLCDLSKKKCPRWLHYTLIISVFLYLFALAVESLLVLLMDVTFCEGLSIAFGADFENFLELLYLSDLGLGAWLSLLIVAIAAPFLALGFYFACRHVENKTELSMQNSIFIKTGMLSLSFLLALDLGMTGKFSSEDIDNYKKMLPWKAIFFKIQERHLKLSNPIEHRPPLTRKDLVLNKQQLTHLPNIYLIITESLRDDFITEATAPTLTQFKTQCIQTILGRSSANCTHLSWFSLFHSKHPFYWSYHKTAHFNEGSLPLSLLKEAGYKVHVYSAAQLRFYHFDKVLFGNNHYLADTFKVFPHYNDLTPAQADQSALQTLMEDSLFHKSYGNVYILFFDSTHFNYSWPKEFKAPFEPCQDLSWIHRLSIQKDHLEIIKNRYRNSIVYVDTLFDKLVQNLKQRGIFDDSFIVFCGDHGEEFKEQGKLFHASNLNDYQTRIPIYMKLGNSKASVATLSHVDIFPSILDALFDNPAILKPFDGESVFKYPRINHTLSARYHASFMPYRFMLVSKDGKALFEFDNKEQVFDSKYVKVLSSIDNKSETDLMEALRQLFLEK